MVIFAVEIKIQIRNWDYCCLGQVWSVARRTGMLARAIDSRFLTVRVLAGGNRSVTVETMK